MDVYSDLVSPLVVYDQLFDVDTSVLGKPQPLDISVIFDDCIFLPC